MSFFSIYTKWSEWFPGFFDTETTERTEWLLISIPARGSRPYLKATFVSVQSASSCFIRTP